MRPILQQLIKRFAGRDVFIIGGGNSLKGFDFSRLKGKCVIALNVAYKHVDADAVLYWADTSWGHNEMDNGLLAHPSPYKFSTRHNAQHLIDQNRRGMVGEYWLNRTGMTGYDPDIDSVRGSHSGAQALNFAVNLQAKRVILLGFDMGAQGGRTHFHDDYGYNAPPGIYAETFIPSMEGMAAELKNYPVQVINCNKQSALRCFDFGDVEDYL